MAVSRKDILPESTIEPIDIETWIDTELNKTSNKEILKKYGVLVLIDYNTKWTKLEYRDRDVMVHRNKMYDTIADIYSKKGWNFQYETLDEYTLVKLS